MHGGEAFMRAADPGAELEDMFMAPKKRPPDGGARYA
jgi:hypothetical protein